MNMRVGPLRFLALWLLVCLQGCQRLHLRPENVPSSAVWVDNTFVDCSVEAQSRANRCTVYRDDSGEILADGLFRLSTVYAPADSTVYAPAEKSELRYAAFGNGMIYLQDARVLVQCAASDRDPSRRIVTNRLKALAIGNSSKVIDCNEHSSEKSDDPATCAIKALEGQKAFYVRYYLQGTDSFSFTGFVGDEAGNVYEVKYPSRGLFFIGALPKGAQFFDDHTLVLPCAKPINLERTANGSVSLSCFRPVAQ
jgi:hypothetical protein